MKRILAAAIIAFIVLISCYFQGDSSTGSITIDVQAAGAKAIGDIDTYDTARVYLLSGNTDLGNALFDFGGGQIYAQVAIENGKATVQGAPVGRWNVLLALGSLEGPGGDVFYVQKYGESGATQILSGVSNEVAITLSVNPFTTAEELFDKDVVGVAKLGTSVYAAEPGALHGYTDAGFSSYFTPLGSFPVGHVVNSLSPGLDAIRADVLYLNTSEGIVTYDGSSYDDTFSSGLGAVSVLDAGAYVYGSVALNTVVYFQRDGGLGGVLLDTLPYDWIDVDLSDVITGQPVLDFEIVDDPLDCVFFVTKLGAFALATELLDGHTADEVFDLAVFFNNIDGTFYSIRSLGYDPSAGGTMYLGTDDGAYKGTPAAPPAATFASLSPVPGTAGMAIDKVEVSLSGAYVAFLSNLNLYVSNGTDMVKIPFHGGLPGRVRRMTWDGNVLLIAGSTGLVSLNAPSLWP